MRVFGQLEHDVAPGARFVLAGPEGAFAAYEDRCIIVRRGARTLPYEDVEGIRHWGASLTVHAVPAIDHAERLSHPDDAPFTLTLPPALLEEAGEELAWLRERLMDERRRRYERTNPHLVDELERLWHLYGAGTLDDDEFSRAKGLLLHKHG